MERKQNALGGGTPYRLAMINKSQGEEKLKGRSAKKLEYRWKEHKETFSRFRRNKESSTAKKRKTLTWSADLRVNNRRGGERDASQFKSSSKDAQTSGRGTG